MRCETFVVIVAFLLCHASSSQVGASVAPHSPFARLRRSQTVALEARMHTRAVVGLANIHVAVHATSSVGSLDASSFASMVQLVPGHSVTVTLQAKLAGTWTDGVSPFIDPAVGLTDTEFSFEGQTFSQGLLVARVGTSGKWRPVSQAPTFSVSASTPASERVLQLAHWYANCSTLSGTVYPAIFFGVLDLLSSAASDQVVTQPWKHNGIIYVSQGLQLAISLPAPAQTWQLSDDVACNATGLADTPYAYNDLSYPQGALVAKIGISDWYYVGNGFTTAAESGTLILASWDATDDNHAGQLDVVIRLTAPMFQS